MQTASEILEIKHAVRARDGMRCTRCGMDNADHLDLFYRRLEVHRVEPGSLYSLEGCITLCWRCHQKEKKSKPHTTATCILRVKQKTFSRLRLMALQSGDCWVGVAQFLDDLVEADYARFEHFKESHNARDKEKKERDERREIARQATYAAKAKESAEPEDEQLPPDGVSPATAGGRRPIPD